MKNFYCFKYIFLLLCFTATQTLLHAQNIDFIDVDKFTNSYPLNVTFKARSAFATLNGYAYFTADDGNHGRELWRTNGTTAGTKLVKNINPGNASSENYRPYDITSSGDKIFFTADGGPGKRGLWVSDGTAAGTQFLADVSNGGNDAQGGAFYMPSYLTDVNGMLFFAVSYYDNQITFNYVNQLWKSDGTVAGTVLIADFGSNGTDLNQLTNVNGRLFFTYFNYDPTGNELYTSDGTAAGTYLVADINPNSYSGSNPSELTASNGLLYFIADDGSGSGTKLFRSDGTGAGTYAVNNNGIICYSTSYPNYIDTFAIINNVIYLQGSDASGINTLYKYDEAKPAAGVTLVKNIIPGVSSYPSFMTNVNGTLFFTIGPAGADAELWKSNGTASGTKRVKDINPGGYNGYSNLTAANNILFFTFNDNVYGNELWKSDGTAAGTGIVKNINPGIYSSNPGYLTYLDSSLLFSAYDGVNGYELWKSNGTAANTTIVKDINKTATSSSYATGFTSLSNNKTVFEALNTQYGSEVWITNGTAAGTNLLKDIYKGSEGSAPTFFTKLKNKVYFFATDSSGNHLYQTNGMAAGTKAIPTSLDDRPSRYISAVIPGADLFYIFLYNFNTSQYELWRSDGTHSGTSLLDSTLAVVQTYNLVVIGNTLFFTNDDYGVQYGNELWKSEGTPATTSVVKDIVPGINGSYPFDLINYNGKLYFAAYNSDGTYTQVLWTSDGTEAGTKILKPLYVARTNAFAKANGKFFFEGENTVTHGFELYGSDGTSAGTKLVKDIYKGPGNSDVNMLVSGDTLIYFTANNGVNGQTSLWRSNGTSKGTFMVADVVPGAMININDKLYFTVNDSLWVSNGTKKGTAPISNPVLEGVTNFSDLTNVNGVLYFTGYTYAAGQELYVLNPSNNETPVAVVNNSVIASMDNNTFTAKLLTNPITYEVKIVLSTKTQQDASLKITDITGRTLITDKKVLPAGTSTLSYPASSWTKGMYIVTIVTSNQSTATLKVLK